jgi:hypothetical protein
MKGTTTPIVPTVKPVAPTCIKSEKVISKPAANKISMPPMSPKALTIEFISITGEPPIVRMEPNA